MFAECLGSESWKRGKEDLTNDGEKGTGCWAEQLYMEEGDMIRKCLVG